MGGSHERIGGGGQLTGCDHELLDKNCEVAGRSQHWPVAAGVNFWEETMNIRSAGANLWDAR
eukprot:1373886-Rhodomonas_salina.1